MPEFVLPTRITVPQPPPPPPRPRGRPKRNAPKSDAPAPPSATNPFHVLVDQYDREYMAIPLQIPRRAPLPEPFMEQSAASERISSSFQTSDRIRLGLIAKERGITPSALVRDYCLAMLELIDAGLVVEPPTLAQLRAERAPPKPEKRGPGRPRKHPVGQSPKRKHRKKRGPGRPKLTLRQKCLREAAARRAKIAAEDAWMAQDHVFGND